MESTNKFRKAFTSGSKKKLCKICNKEYDPKIMASHKCKMKQDDRGGGHTSSPIHKQKCMRLEFFYG